MPLLPYVELFSIGQEFALVIPRPSFGSTAASFYSGANESDLVGFSSVISQELGRIREIWDQPTSKTWALMLLTGGGIAFYLLCKNKSDEDTEKRFSGLTRRRRSRWAPRSWIGRIFDGSDDSLPVFEGQYFGPLLGAGPSNEPPRKFEGPKLVFAPCPNCLKGSCKVKKHQKIFASRLLTVAAESSTSSSSTSPLRLLETPFAFPHATSTPDLADDEDSDLEDGVLQRVSDLHKSTELFHSSRGIDNRIDGDGQNATSRHNSTSGSCKSTAKHRIHSDRKSGKSRIPPEGREKRISPTKRNSSLRHQKFNLSCGDVTCKDTFCLNNNSITLDREVSVDSISNISKGMVKLVQGAREVRRLIREASFDSMTSEFSLGVSIIEDPCEGDFSGRGKFKFESRCCNTDPLRDSNEVSCSENEDQEFKSLQQKCTAHQKLWRLSAPINGSDFDSPEHKGRTSDEASSNNLISPQHEWQDLKLNKYKMALYGNGSKTHSSSVSDISEAVDGLEWDQEDFESKFDDELSELDFSVANWLESNLELDLEAELSRLNSERSSRRNSMSSDLDSTSLYRTIRLPPSGRSSVTHNDSCCSSSYETPQKLIDKEMLIRSFGVLTTTCEEIERPSSIAYSTKRVPSTLKSPSCSKYKELSPIYDRRNHLRDFLHEQTTVTMSTNGCLVTTTPLSPVHEAKEPRQNKSPANDSSSNCELSPVRCQIFREDSNCALPDLEECNS